MNWLLEKLKSNKDKDALIINNKLFSYNDLLSEIEVWNDILILLGIHSGESVSIEGSNSLELTALIFALYFNKNIIIPIKADSKSRADEYKNISEANYSIDVDNENSGFTNNNTVHKNDLYKRLINDNSAGLVLFSSGTTGQPKGTVLNLDKLILKYQNSESSARLLSFLSYDHIGGINTILYSLCSGGCAIYPLNRTVDTVLKCIEDWRVEVLPTTPTFINMILVSGLLEKYSLRSLNTVTYGTEVMPMNTLKKINEKLPNVKMKQTYGLSEIGILPTKSKNNNELWIKIGGNGFDYKIEKNILWIKSEIAMLGYLNADSAFDEEGYFNTQDVVEVDGEYIKILGRKSDIINIAGEKVYPSEIEGSLCEVDGVLDISVISEKNPITGMAIKARIKHELSQDISSLRERLVTHAKNHLLAYKRPMSYEFTTENLHSSRYKKMRKF